MNEKKKLLTVDKNHPNFPALYLAFRERDLFHGKSRLFSCIFFNDINEEGIEVGVSFHFPEKNDLCFKVLIGQAAAVGFDNLTVKKVTIKRALSTALRR